MTAAENTSIAPRTSRKLKFLRKRGTENYKEFFPGAGSRLHFATRDVDTFVAQGLPAGLLQAGDMVYVQHNDAGVWRTVFGGEVSRIFDRHGRGTDRVQDVTAVGAWDKLNRLVYKQSWSVAGAGTNGAALTISSSRVILNQTAAGASQTMKAQLDEILDYACPKCGITKGTVSALAQVLPADEARDITCADAIRRELRFFPKRIARLNYSLSGTTIQIVDLSAATAADYVASVPKTERVYEYNAHPVKCVDVSVDATDILLGGSRLGDTHQYYPDNESLLDSIDCLHVTVPLERGSASTTSESFESVTEAVPSNLNSVTFWKLKHPRLADVAVSAITITNGKRLDASGNQVTTTTLVNIAKSTKGEIEAAGLHCAVHRFTCDCTISTAEDEEEDIKLSMDFLVTDAETKTYTWQTGSSYVAGETLPSGLAQALFEQLSQSLLSERMTIRLGDVFPRIGDKVVETVDGVDNVLYLQSFDVDCNDLTAQLSFGQPEHLSAADMKSLLNGFRQRGYATTAKLRKNKADEDADEAPAPGGIPPISSSEWSPGVKGKATFKKSGSGTGNKVLIDTTRTGGIITLDTSQVGSGNTAMFHNLKYTDANGTQQTVKVLATADATIPAPSSPSTTDVTVVTGITFDWDANNQLVATVKKKSVKVFDTPQNQTDATPGLGLWKQNVVASSEYSTGTKQFTNNEIGSVRTDQSSATTPAANPVFTATPHSSE